MLVVVVVAHEDGQLYALAARAGEWLRGQGARLALAESCTGGWLAKAITDIPGSSGWFERGWVTYSDAAKTAELGVSGETLASQGAVSEAVARAMAEGALERSGADFAVAVTGIAGPDSGTVEKPVGMVCFAWASRGDAAHREWVITTATHRFDGDREAIRRATVAFALEGLLEA